jgi:hypothetical protein
MKTNWKSFTMTENELSYEIIGAAIEVHRILGPGLLESAYEECVCHELRKKDFILISNFGCLCDIKM